MFTAVPRSPRPHRGIALDTPPLPRPRRAPQPLSPLIAVCRCPEPPSPGTEPAARPRPGSAGDHGAGPASARHRAGSRCLRCTCFASLSYSQVSAWLGRRLAPPFPCLQPVSRSERLCWELLDPARFVVPGFRIYCLKSHGRAGLLWFCHRCWGSAGTLQSPCHSLQVQSTAFSQERGFYFYLGMRICSFEVSFS